MKRNASARYYMTLGFPIGGRPVPGCSALMVHINIMLETVSTRAGASSPSVNAGCVCLPYCVGPDLEVNPSQAGNGIELVVPLAERVVGSEGHVVWRERCGAIE